MYLRKETVFYGEKLKNLSHGTNLRNSLKMKKICPFLTNVNIKRKTTYLTSGKVFSSKKFISE